MVTPIILLNLDSASCPRARLGDAIHQLLARFVLFPLLLWVGPVGIFGACFAFMPGYVVMGTRTKIAVVADKHWSIIAFVDLTRRAVWSNAPAEVWHLSQRGTD